MKKINKSKHEDIVCANLKLLETLPNLYFSLQECSADEIKRLTKTCWACGSGGTQYRCHVVARSKGGLDQPDNYFLLCEQCHEDQPDGLSRDLQEDWLCNRESWSDRYAKIVLGLFAELRQISVTEDVLNHWCQHRGPKRIMNILSEGYQSAAGWKNGRANAFALVKADLKKFVKNPPKKRTKPPVALSMSVEENQNADKASDRLAARLGLPGR